jgi:hypothetical protein
MNSTQNKAALWKSCVEQGLFDKVPPGMQYQVQGLLRRTVPRFPGREKARPRTRTRTGWLG